MPDSHFQRGSHLGVVPKEDELRALPPKTSVIHLT